MIYLCRPAATADAFGTSPDRALHLVHDPRRGWTVSQLHDGNPAQYLDLASPDLADGLLLPMTETAADATWWLDLPAMVTALAATTAAYRRAFGSVGAGTGTGTGTGKSWFTLVTATQLTTRARLTLAALNLLAILDPDRARTESVLLALAYPQLLRLAEPWTVDLASFRPAGQHLIAGR